MRRHRRHKTWSQAAGRVGHAWTPGGQAAHLTRTAHSLCIAGLGSEQLHGQSGGVVGAGTQFQSGERAPGVMGRAARAQGMAGNIIHAIATTNAIVGGLIVVEALKVLARRPEACRVRAAQHAITDPRLF